MRHSEVQKYSPKTTTCKLATRMYGCLLLEGKYFTQRTETKATDNLNIEIDYEIKNYYSPLLLIPGFCWL